MRIAVMQPYLFPYIGYFQLINSVDKFVVFDDVNYINKGWINRNNILINGKANLFTIPLKEASQNKLINEICIVDQGQWASKFLKTIDSTYKKAPFFDEAFKLINEVIYFESKNISDYIYNSIKKICEYLEIETDIIPSSEKYKLSDLKGEAKIIKICQLEGADQYINPIGGLELYSRENFNEISCDLKFIKTNPITYKQFKNEFVPWLSIIDILMFNSKNEIIEILGSYELV